MSTFNQPQKFLVYAVWQAPGPLQISPIFRANTGRPARPESAPFCRRIYASPSALSLVTTSCGGRAAEFLNSPLKAGLEADSLDTAFVSVK